MAMIPSLVQRRALQVVVATLSVIPIATGLAGAAFGVRVFDPASSIGQDADSLGRYLSGLLLAVGLGFWSTVPRIEAQGARFRLLAVLVFTGGLARLVGLLVGELPSKAMLGGLALELFVTPALALWRERIERAARRGAP
jgi:hypothetical protein